MTFWRPALACLLTIALGACTMTPTDPREMTFKQYKKSLGRDMNNPYATNQDLQDYTNWQAAGGYKSDAPNRPKRSGGSGASMSDALSLAVAGMQLAQTIKGTQSSSASRGSSYVQQPSFVTQPQQAPFGSRSTLPSRPALPGLTPASSRSNPWAAATSPTSRNSGTPTPLTWNSSPLRIVDSYSMGNGLQGITVANTSNSRVSARIWKQGERPEHAGSYTLSPGERITGDATFKYLKGGQHFLFSLN